MIPRAKKKATFWCLTQKVAESEGLDKTRLCPTSSLRANAKQTISFQLRHGVITIFSKILDCHVGRPPRNDEIK